MLRDADTAFGRVDPGSSLLDGTLVGGTLLGGTGTRPGAGQTDAQEIDAEQIDAPWGGDVVVHDAHLLFQGEYSRVGFDLVIRDDAHRLTVHDYFRPGRRPNLVSEEGASLSGQVVEALALAPHGPRYAQAGTAPAAPTIGRVETVGGTASVLRNGSAVALNVGDLVYRGDVVQTGGGSSLGITFIDGTAFSLLSGARMVLNDMVYTPGGTGNSALISLVQGSISFVAGQVAKTGDMRVDTPVATMGIRGTAVNVDISADNGTTRFSVMREPDGRVGSYVLYSRTDPNVILATVSQVDVGILVEANGSVTSFTKTPGDLGTEQLIVQLVFQLFNAGQANPIVVTPAPAAPAPPPGGPQGGGGGGSSTPPDGAAGNGSSGPASPQFPAPVTPPQPDGAPPGPAGPGAPPPAAQSPSGGGGTTQQTSNTTGSVDTGTDVATTGAPTNAATAGQPATGAPTTPPAQTSPSQPGSTQPNPAQPNPVQTGPAETSPAQATPPVPFTPKTVTVAADDLVLASGSRDGVLARDGASDASIATEHVVSAHATAGFDVAVGPDPTSVTGTYGTLAIRQDGSYSYLALRATALAQGETGDDVFTFTVQEADGSRTTSTITFHVEGKNDAPTAAPDRGADLSAGSVVDAAVKGAGVLANDTDPDRGETAALAVSAVAPKDAPGTAVAPGTPATVAGLYGELTIASDGTYHYVADHAQALANGVVGEDVFTYTITDPNGATSSASLTFGVTGVNDAPVAQDQSATLEEDGSTTITPVATDPDATDTLTYSVVTGPKHGSVVFESGSFRYTPTGDYDGPDGFTYRANDGTADSSVATVTLTVTPVNDAPVARDQNATLAEDGSTTIMPAATDPDATDTLTYSVVTGPKHGSVTFESGTFRYVPAADYDGPDSFTYRANDGTAGSNVATVTLTVTGVNDAPVARDQSATLAEDGSTTITPAATDPDATDTLTYSLVTGPQHGSVVFESGSFRYTPTGDYDGPDSFTYRANDGTADSSVATVTLTVTPVNDAPVIDLDTGTAGTGTTAEYSGPVPIAPGPVSITDPDTGATIDHVTLTLAGSGGPDTIDTLSLDAGASAAYAIDPGSSDGVYVLHRRDGQPGTASDYADALSHVVFTSGDDTTDRTVTIAVTPNDGTADGTAAVSTVHVPALPGGMNQAPQVTPSGTTTAYAFGGTPVVVDPAITVSDADSPTLDHATVRVSLDDLSLVAGDLLRITAGSGFTVDSVTDDLVGFADGGVIHQSFADGTLTLTGEGASPADFQAAFEAVAFSTTNETESRDRRVSFTANDGVSESYAVSDHVAVRFTPNDIFTTPLDTPITADVPAGAGTTYAFGAPAHGTVVAADPNDPRAFTYTPAAGYSGPDSFAYTVDDGAGGTTIGHITIGVDPNQGGQFGFALASLGDLDGDGLADMSASAPSNYDGAGLVFISRNNGGDHQYQVQGSPGEQLGYALAGLGDLGRDGTPDLVAGAPGANGGAGAAYVVFGRADTSNTTTIMTSSLDGTSTEGFAITGAAPRDHAGSSVAAAGYVNGDAIPDILVGAPDAGEGAGAAYLIYGKADTVTVPLAAIEGGDTANGIAIHGAAGDHLGFSVAGGGDIDADGFADFVLGAPGDRTTPGSVYVIHGEATLGNIDVTDPATFTGLDFKITGAANGDMFGYAVANIGDVNGDGYDDFAIGAPHATALGRAEAGMVYVIYGASDLSGIDVSNLGTRGFTISGAAAGDHLGTSVAFAGDVNGDGLADIIVGAPDNTNGGRPGDGSAYIVLGSTTGQNVDVGLQSTNLSGFNAEDHLGSSVSTTGDSSGSGLAGFASGAPRSYDTNSNTVNSGSYGSTAYSPQAFTSGDADGNTLTGTAGSDIIGGKQGNDRISGLGGADVLNGGQGHDVFVFTSSDATGRTVVTDFHPYATTPAQGERDQLDVASFQVAIATLLANAMQVNSHDTLVTLDAEHSILLKNVLKASLTADDFAIPSA